MSFEAKPGSLLNLFRDTDVDQYKIPKYQRAYSWTEEQVKVFCEDLYYAYSNCIEDYFFGAVIMIKDSTNEKIRNIIDGQQRITTFTILIAQLRNLCEEILFDLEIDSKSKIKYKRQIKQIRDKISDLSQCIEYNIKNDRTIFKLELSNTDKTFFEECLRISKKKDILDTLESIIDFIEEKSNVETDYSELDELRFKNKNKILNIQSTGQNIKFIDLYNELCKDLKTKYEKIKLREHLIIRYLDEKLPVYNIDLNKCMSDLYIEGEDKENIMIFIDSFGNTSHKPASHAKILKAWDIIEEELIKPIMNIREKEVQVEGLINLIDTFIKKTYIVTIISTNEDTAYTMFQVLNDRGRSLGVIDLLRPYTLQMLEGSQYSENTSKNWDKLAEKEDCDKYLATYIESYMKVSSTDKKIHNKYKEKFFKSDTEPLEVAKKIEHILQTYEVYEKIKNGEWPYDTNKTNAWHKNRLKQIISRLSYSKSIPLLLAVYDECTEEDFVSIIDIMERVVFRYITVCEKKSTNLMAVYSKTIEEIRKNKKLNLSDFKIKMNELLKEQGSTMEDFKVKLEGKKLTYSNSSKKRIQYFLSTLEYYYNDYICNNTSKVLMNPTKTILNDTNIWIEHIYSQEARVDYKNDYMDNVVNKIGNLTLLQDSNNRKLGNKSFNEKKSGKDYGYDKEKISITNILKVYNKWEKDEYKIRREMYLDMASKIFTLDGE